MISGIKHTHFDIDFALTHFRLIDWSERKPFFGWELMHILPSDIFIAATIRFFLFLFLFRFFNYLLTFYRVINDYHGFDFFCVLFRRGVNWSSFGSRVKNISFEQKKPHLFLMLSIIVGENHNTQSVNNAKFKTSLNDCSNQYWPLRELRNRYYEMKCIFAEIFWLILPQF